MASAVIQKRARITVKISGAEPEVFEGELNANAEQSGALQIIDFATLNRIFYAPGVWIRCDVEVLES